MSDTAVLLTVYDTGNDAVFTLASINGLAPSSGGRTWVQHVSGSIRVIGDLDDVIAALNANGNNFVKFTLHGGGDYVPNVRRVTAAYAKNPSDPSQGTYVQEAGSSLWVDETLADVLAALNA